MSDYNALLARADELAGAWRDREVGRLFADLAAALRLARDENDELRRLLAQWVHLIRNEPERIHDLLTNTYLAGIPAAARDAAGAGATSTQMAVIKRLLTGWMPYYDRSHQSWVHRFKVCEREPMTDAERATINVFDDVARDLAGAGAAEGDDDE